jgi:uncharacterized protein
MMNIPEFTDDQAVRLEAFLSSPERPEGTMTYGELAGFLFAVACSPESVPPSEWLPLIFDEEGGGYRTLDEAQEILVLIMALYNHVNRGALERKPQLPPRCTIDPEPMANLEPDATLSLWARGFGEGHDWVVELWEEYAPDEWDEELGACLMVLTFFASRQLADAYRKETKRPGTTLKKMASEMAELISGAMVSYAHMGRSIHEVLLQRAPRR